ncbi:MAG: extensin family protein [Hyphomicrobiaceae bacterium]
MQGALRKAILAVLLMVAVAVLLIWARPPGVPRLTDIWPLDLEAPPGLLLDWQLQDVDADPRVCARTLAVPGMNAKPIADKPKEAGCGWHNAVHLIEADDVAIHAAVVRCGVTAALAMWLRQVVQPAAMQFLKSRVTKVSQFGTYSCRNMRGSARLAGHRSQHATANAIDIGGFTLADGRRISLTRDWGRPTPAGQFLAAVHEGACRYFRVVLGPSYNPAHHDHFHLDRGWWRACR